MAWRRQVEILKPQLNGLHGHVFFEFAIPRMGMRADVVLIVSEVVFVLEFKVGSHCHQAADIRQVESYALDLKNFHAGSHRVPIVPVLVATESPPRTPKLIPRSQDVFDPVLSNGCDLRVLIRLAARGAHPSIAPLAWAQSAYLPTPTIIEAAQALYANHAVEDIARFDAGARNLALTSQRIHEIVHFSRLNGRKSICFVTGVPGAGKTLAGLNIATSSPEEEHAVFLSGNGPLVAVLREALARDEVVRNPGLRKADATRKVRSFVQNIHHFRDDALATDAPPVEKVVVFDEAQRAWDRHHTTQFMVGKRGMSGFDMSEPEFLVSVMDRHRDWCVIVALVGGGQEINTGEMGLIGWRDAMESRFPHWDVYYSDRLRQTTYVGQEIDFSRLPNTVVQLESYLHLATSMRSFRAESLSELVHYLVAGSAVSANAAFAQLSGRFPIQVTRDLTKARQWLRSKARGKDSIGIVASSGALRLRPHAINVQNSLDAPIWFLNDSGDVRSSGFLEEVATEFEVQGLELDWVLVGWDADLRHNGREYEYWRFRGTSWSRRNQESSRRYLANAYRVLLTRARQGIIIFVPHGDPEDATRLPSYYDGTYAFLRQCGIPEL